jgi:imidazolonepropionase-like amidohydrolase
MAKTVLRFPAMRIALSFLLAFASLAASAQTHFSDDVKRYVSVDSPTFAITHVRVIDGTGAAPLNDQTIVVSNGKIVAVGAAAAAKIPAGASVLDKSGYTVIPGLVGMHNHLYYTASLYRDERGASVAPGFFINEIPFTAPRLYLAAGVTTMRTGGSLEPFTDVNVKKDISLGTMPGPKMDLTAPYLEGEPGGATFPQMHELTGPDDARRWVDFWADQGFTSFKAYMHIKSADLKAAIDEAHKRGFKLTGHLCSVGYKQAAELGIDDLEHGFIVDSDFAKSKQPDQCPSGKEINDGLMAIDPSGPEAQALFKTLIDHHVAVTSTLPVFEAGYGLMPISDRILAAMSAESRTSYLSARARIPNSSILANEGRLRKAMQMEFAFAKAGGILLAGPDPTGNGGVLPGFGDQREVELLVQAGFTPIDAIKIATSNGAQYMGILDKTGTIAAGKAADLVLIHGDPSQKIEEIEKVETVFKGGIGFDSAKLIESVRGQVGIR